MADAESLWLSYSDPNEDILSVGSCKEHSLCIQCETLNSIFCRRDPRNAFETVFMGSFRESLKKHEKTLHIKLSHRRIASNHK